jgi:hypothetical protein
MDDSQLCSAVAARFYAINGIHPMTAEDDAYASEWYVQLEALAESGLLVWRHEPAQDTLFGRRETAFGAPAET